MTQNYVVTFADVVREPVPDAQSYRMNRGSPIFQPLQKRITIVTTTPNEGWKTAVGVSDDRWNSSAPNDKDIVFTPLVTHIPYIDKQVSYRKIRDDIDVIVAGLDEQMSIDSHVDDLSDEDYDDDPSYEIEEAELGLLLSEARMPLTRTQSQGHLQSDLNEQVIQAQNQQLIPQVTVTEQITMVQTQVEGPTIHQPSSPTHQPPMVDLTRSSPPYNPPPNRGEQAIGLTVPGKRPRPVEQGKVGTRLRASSVASQPVVKRSVIEAAMTKQQEAGREIKRKRQMLLDLQALQKAGSSSSNN